MWIKTSEQLPEDDRQVLCFLYQTFEVLSLRKDHQDFFSEHYVIPVTEISYWQPLPAAPEESKY